MTAKTSAVDMNCWSVRFWGQVWAKHFKKDSILGQRRFRLNESFIKEKLEKILEKLSGKQTFGATEEN